MSIGTGSVENLLIDTGIQRKGIVVLGSSLFLSGQQSIALKAFSEWMQDYSWNAFSISWVRGMVCFCLAQVIEERSQLSPTGMVDLVAAMQRRLKSLKQSCARYAMRQKGAGVDVYIDGELVYNSTTG